MTNSVSFETIVNGVLTISGISALIQYCFQKSIEIKFTKEIESLKSSLKNSEVFFIKQLEALSILSSILRKLHPKPIPSDLEMDEYSYYEEIAHNFSNYANKLDEYLCIYSAVLPTAVREHIMNAEHIATDGAFQFRYSSEDFEAEPTTEVIETAKKLYNELTEARINFQNIIEEKLGHQKRTSKSHWYSRK